MRVSEKSAFSVPVVWPVISAIILFIFLAVVFPELCKELLGKEKFIEHVSHQLLIFSIVLCWLSLHKGQRRYGRVFFLIMLVVLLLEETDYGGVYGFNLVTEFFRSHFYTVNFHNYIRLLSGSEINGYGIFKWIIFLYFFFLTFGGRKLKESFYPFYPMKKEIIAVIIIVLFKENPFEFSKNLSYYFQELYECLLYYIFFVIALRGYKDLRKI